MIVQRDRDVELEFTKRQENGIDLCVLQNQNKQQDTEKKNSADQVFVRFRTRRPLLLTVQLPRDRAIT